MRLYLALLLSGMGCSSTDFLLVEARRSHNNRNNPRRKTMHLHPTPNPTTEPTAAPITTLPTFAPTQAPMSNPAGELSSEDGDGAAGTADGGGVTTDSVNPSTSSKPAPIYELQHGRGLFTIASGTGCYAGAKGQAQARFDVTSGSRVDLFVPTVSWIFEEDGPQDTMLKRVDDDSRRRRHLDIGDATTNTTDDHRKLDSSSSSVCDMFHSGKDYFNIITLDLKRQPNPPSSNDAAGGSGGTLKDSTTTFHEHGSFQAREHWYQGVEGLYSLTCLFHECKMSFFFHIDDDGSAATTARRGLLSDSGQEAEMTSLQLQGTTELAYEGAGTDRLVCVENCDVLGSVPVSRYSGVGTDAEFFEETINVRGFDNTKNVVELQQTSAKAAKGTTTTAKAAKGTTTTTAKAAKGGTTGGGTTTTAKAAKGTTTGTKAPKGGQPSPSGPTPPGPSPTPLGPCADPDVTPPVMNCQDLTVDLPQSQTVTITTAQIDNGSADECGVPTLVLSTDTFTCFNVGPNAITLTGTDASGNTASCVAIVTVVDRPTATCLPSYTADLDANGMVTVRETDINFGSSTVCGSSLTYDLTPSTFSCSDIGTQSVTLTVTTTNGDTATCTSVVTVRDNRAPTASCATGVISFDLDATGSATIDPSQLNSNSDDNCGASTLSFSVSPTTLSCANEGSSTSVTLTVTDTSGNFDTCTSNNVQANDVTSPTAICQSSITEQLDDTGMATVTTTEIDAGSTDICGPLTLTMINPASYTCADIGSGNLATLQVTDGAGNSDTCDSPVIVQDNIAPVARCNNAVTQPLQTGTNPSVTILPGLIDNSSTDNCNTVTLSLSQSTFDCSDLGNNLVTLSVVDSSNNVDTCRSTVTITDVTDPTAICQDINQPLDSNGNLIITANAIDAGSRDDCGGPLTYMLGTGDTLFTCNDIATSPRAVTLTVTDESNNSDSINTCTVTVYDNLAPNANCASRTVFLAATDPANVDLDGAALGIGSTDNCDNNLDYVTDPVQATCANAGTNLPYTLTVLDDYGNSDTCSSSVTVVDNTSPTAICQDYTATLDANGQVTVSAENDLDNGSTDNCGIAAYTISGSPTVDYDCNDIGANQVLFQVSDTSNPPNIAFCDVDSVTAGNQSPTVTVQDLSAPTANCQSISIDLRDEGGMIQYTMQAEEMDPGQLLSMDNCKSLGLTYRVSTDGTTYVDELVFDCADQGNFVPVTIQVTDSATVPNTSPASTSCNIGINGSPLCSSP